MVQVLRGPTSPLPPPLSVMSYNVLLPNSQDGWWTYKMYNPPVSEPRIASWEYRRDLIEERIRRADPSIVCFQEVSPVSFEHDFSFMSDLGFDGHELFRKGRFRPATFWKTDHCQLVAEPVHKDRTLLTAFQCHPDADRDDVSQNWYILNCHLQAGTQGPRRVRQIHEGVRSALTLARKLKETEPEDIPLIVCGDFNGGSECGALRYLEDGRVDESFWEDGAPVTSSEKKLPLAHPMYDVMTVGRNDGEAPPPTMVVTELISLLTAPKASASGQGEATAWENPDLSDDMRARLERIFRRLASGTAALVNGNDSEAVMTVANVKDWLTRINGQVGRGDEFRQAARQMGWRPPADDPEARITALPPDGVLTLEGFIAVYEAELRGGKFWGIAHDMSVLDDPLPTTELYTARYDRLYASTAVETTAVMDFVATQSCPNAAEPSDHLPIAASFRLRKGGGTTYS